jgi:Arc/MetJ-type ribon-helix-helix transcriptional regulator
MPMPDKKVQVTISLPQPILDWIDSEIASKRFANRSHAIEYCVYQEEKKEGNPGETTAASILVDRNAAS